jgi:SAM-dependent methyltransferase
MSNHATEVQEGNRFEFGANWSRFLSVLNDSRIQEAKLSLISMLNVESLEGKTFLDIGSGSGLFSLSARMLGAKVHSFDYDPKSVACTTELKKRYFDQDSNWVVESGSVLDRDYMTSLGQFDYVYSWGVLHHTGEMWKALENAHSCVKPNGILFIAIYNDQGAKSLMWHRVKKIYCSGTAGRWAIISFFLPYFLFGGLIKDLLVRRKNPLKRYSEYKKSRGMSASHDWIDWLGGYPFEVAKPEEIFDFYRGRGYVLNKLRTCGGGLGCNEYVFASNFAQK